jgi:hypothetical protein
MSALRECLSARADTFARRMTGRCRQAFRGLRIRPATAPIRAGDERPRRETEGTGHHRCATSVHLSRRIFLDTSFSAFLSKPTLFLTARTGPARRFGDRIVAGRAPARDPSCGTFQGPNQPAPARSFR